MLAEGGSEDGWSDWRNNAEDFGVDQPDIRMVERFVIQTVGIVPRFIGLRLVQRDHLESAALERQANADGTPVNQVAPLAILSHTIRQISDNLDSDPRLQSQIAHLPADYAVFRQLATLIFSDRVYSLGRVAMLFYVAYKLVKRALGNGLLVLRIIEWIARFIRDFLADWILSRVGLNGIQEYVGSTSGQALGVFLAGILTACIVYWKYS